VAVPKAGLTMTIQKVVGTENGCDSNSEAFDESGGLIADKANPLAPCNVKDSAGQLSAGQFLQQAAFYVQADKVTSPTACDGWSASNQVLSNTPLLSVKDKAINLLNTNTTLAGGEGVCVLAHVFMPKTNEVVGITPDNASQGDQASFDVRFDLSQI
jgi:hypothetical protein